MRNLDVKHVCFLGSELLAAKDQDEQVWVGVSYICNGIGLNKNEKDRQVKNIQADETLQEGCVKFDAGVFDPHNPTVALRLDFVPLWLAKISITPTMKESRPDVAERLKQFQLKAKDVLAEAFIDRQISESRFADLSPELRLLINLEISQKQQAKELAEVKQEMQDIRDAVALHPDQWREETRRLISKIAQARGGGGAYQEVNEEIYSLVNVRGGVNLRTRLANKYNRMAGEGARKSQLDKLNKLDVIAEDKKLREIYIAIVKEMAVKFGISVGT